jgi:hypothetical protein
MVIGDWCVRITDFQSEVRNFKSEMKWGVVLHYWGEMPHYVPPHGDRAGESPDEEEILTYAIFAT